jgi:hypothetical protein
VDAVRRNHTQQGHISSARERGLSGIYYSEISSVLAEFPPTFTIKFSVRI